MALLIFLLVIAAGALISLGLAGYGSPLSIKIQENEPQAEQLKKPKAPSYFSYLIPFSRAFLEKLGLDVRIKRRLDAAHVKMTAAGFFNLKVLLMILLPIAAYFALGRLEAWVLVLCLLLGYFIPEIILNRKIAKRRFIIVRYLPETVDLIGLCVEAGLDFNSALKWIIEKLPPSPIIEEFSFVLEEIKWGKPRSQALKDMSKRLNILEISSFVHTLAQAERMGTPVADAFAILSEDSRLQRYHRGERIALQAPIKILIPLIFCILPVIAIIVGGPILLNFMQGGLLNGLGQ